MAGGDGGARIKFSSSTDGQPIAVAVAASPGTLIHTSVATPGQYDAIYLWAANTTAGAIVTTTQFGGVAANNALVLNIAAQSIVKVVDGAILNNGDVVRVYCVGAAGINIFGYAVRLVSSG